MTNYWIFLNQPTPFIDDLYNLARNIEYHITLNGLIRRTVPLINYYAIPMIITLIK
jgi:hypothetical protein